MTLAASTVDRSLEWWARTTPERPAIVFEGDELSYAELDRWANATAARIRSEGVEPGDRVGLVASNSLEWCVLMLATFKVGGIFTPFNARLVRRELDVILADCEPRMVFSDRAHEELLDGVSSGPGAPLVRGLEDAVTELRGTEVGRVADEPDPADPCLIVYTSGSTGTPKGVIHTHETVAAFILEWSLIEPTYSPGVKKLMNLPLYTAGGTMYNVCRLVVHGGTLFLESRLDPEVSLRLLHEHRIDSFSGVPLVFERMSALPEFADADLSCITHAQVGGARVSLALLEAWQTKGVVLRQLYGMTEAGGLATLAPPDRALSHPEQCGCGGVFTRLRVVDGDGEDCPPGTAGEILIRGPGVTPGYWRNPEATAATIVDGWLHSGDLGVLDDEGYLTFQDRMKDMIISGGLNISPLEIENVISDFEGVLEVSVIAVDDNEFGETGAAIVRLAGPVQVEALIEHCNGQLSDYKVPRYVVPVDEPLPRTASGKIAKQAVRTRWADVPASHPRVR